MDEEPYDVGAELYEPYEVGAELYEPYEPYDEDDEAAGAADDEYEPRPANSITRSRETKQQAKRTSRVRRRRCRGRGG